MTAVGAVVAVAGVAALVAALARWLRVAQREHYLAGSCLATARRWVARRPPNAAVAPLGAVAGAVAVVAVAAGWPVPALVAGVVAAAAAAAFPFPLAVHHRASPLRLTRRARVLALVSVALAAAVAVAAALAGAAAAGPVLAAVLAPALVDGAAALTGPFERRAMERHRRRAEARLRAVGPRVVAVTGSWGKTSTKVHVRDLVAGSLEVVASPASWNNTGGLSRTINEHLTDGCEVLVAEMGMYGPGEIRALCSWLRPEVAVICAVGPMHLERVGSMEGIVAAKAEILEGARVGVLWVDDAPLAALADRLGAEGRTVWRVGAEPPAGVAGPPLDVSVRAAGGAVEVLHRGAVVGSLPAASGVHPGNAACAVAAALALGLDQRAVGSRLPTLSNPAHRATGGRTERGVWVVDDTFNANPAGARAALAALGAAVPAGRRAVVTPGMVELGRVQAEANRALAADVVASGATLVAVGWTNRAALVAGAGGSAVVVADREAARAWVRQNLGEGDGVLWENDLPDHYP